MAKRVTVYVVLHDVNYSGPAEDGTDQYRTRDKGAAERFAAGKTCYGSAAIVTDQEVSIETARRWGLA